MRTSEALYRSREFQAAAGLQGGRALRPGGLELTRRALEFLNLPAGARVLDLGCGPGETLGLLRESGYQACGLEPEADFAAEAAARPDLAGRIIQGRAQALPFADSSQAALFCECVLSLLPDQEKVTVLAEMRRVLHPGGWLVLSDLYLREQEAAERPSAPSSCLDGAVSLTGLENLLSRAGFFPVLVEDYSRALAELAARLIFAGDFSTFLGFGCQDGGAGRPGYILIVAQRSER